jgi:hypothetical protein
MSRQPLQIRPNIRALTISVSAVSALNNAPSVFVLISAVVYQNDGNVCHVGMTLINVNAAGAAKLRRALPFAPSAAQLSDGSGAAEGRPAHVKAGRGVLPGTSI